MNKLLKKIFQIVALLATCGSALAADLPVTDVTLEGAGIKVYITGISSTYSNIVGDWTWVKSSGTIDVANAGVPQSIPENSYVYVTLTSAPTALTGVNEYILTETITGDNIKISLNGTDISYSSAGGGGGGGGGDCGGGAALPVEVSGSSKTHQDGAGLFVYITGYPGDTYTQSTSAYTYTTESGTPTISALQDAAASYLYFTLSAGTTSGERVYTITHTASGACAKLTFADGQTTPTVTACSSSEPCVTLICGTPTATTVPLTWTTNIDDEDINNITLSVDGGAPIILTKIGTSWPTEYTVSGLNKGMTHTFSIALYYTDGGSTPLESECEATTLNTSGCNFTSRAKELKDESWKNGCDFTSDYTINVNTSSTNPLALTVTYTKPTDIDPGNNVILGIKRRTVDPNITDLGKMTNNGDGTYSKTITAEVLRGIGVTSAGDSILVAVKNEVGSCASTGMYCTKFMGYAIGVGCNEAFEFSFTKRTEDQHLFTLNTSASMIRIGVKPQESLIYTYYTLDTAANSYILNISDYEVGVYNFVLFDQNGVSSGIKVLHAVY